MNRKKTAWIILIIVLLGPFQIAFADIGEYSNALTVISMVLTVIGAIVAIIMLNTGDNQQAAH